MHLKIHAERNRWLLLSAATVSMMLIGLYQYSWTVFSFPLQQELRSTLTAIQLNFTIYTWVSTWTQPIVGAVVDKRGPLVFSISGGLLTSIGWILSSVIKTVESLYLSYGIGGIGVGIIYTISVSMASRWFPERRGFATGIVIFGFGFGALIFNPIISWIIATAGYRSAFLFMGIIMGSALLLLGCLSRYPSSEWLQKQKATGVTIKNQATNIQFSPKEMVKTRQWWILYSTFILTANTGLMITAQLTYLGSFFTIKEETLVLASAIFPFTNGLGRVAGGFISDKIGRERTMKIYFTLQGVLALLLLSFGAVEGIFVVIIALIGLLWGPIFTFFPAIIADYYGTRSSTVNYGLTYTAKGWGGLLGGYVAAFLSSAFSGFTTPILASATFNFIGTLLIFLLRRPTSKTNV